MHLCLKWNSSAQISGQHNKALQASNLYLLAGPHFLIFFYFSTIFLE